MKLSTIASILFIAATTTASAEDLQKIRVASEGVYPPFNYIENGSLKGFDIDIGNALCAQARLQCEFVVQDWDGMIPGLVAKKYDAIIASMYITAERRKKVAFTEKYYDSPASFVAPKHAKVIDVSPEALAGKTIGAQGSTTSQNYLEEKYKDVELRIYTTVDDALIDLQSGRLDLVISDKIQISHWLSNSGGEDCCELVGGDLSDPIFGEGKGIAIRQDDVVLREKFNAALKAILSDGTYKEINAKYFPFSIY